MANVYQHFVAVQMEFGTVHSSLIFFTDIVCTKLRLFFPWFSCRFFLDLSPVCLLDAQVFDIFDVCDLVDFKVATSVV